MAEIERVSFYPSHTKQWTVHGNFRSIGTVQVEFDLPENFKQAIIKMAQVALDKKESELRCALLGGETQGDSK